MKKFNLLFVFFFFTNLVFAESEEVKIIFTTSLGEYTLELYPEEAPKTVENFLSYVDEGYYDGTIFHRVIPGFMAQGGGFEPGLKQKATKQPVANESTNGISNERGTIAMARTQDPHSATSQFFINVQDNWSLDAQGTKFGYTVFGKVVSGMNVIDQIVNTPTTTVRPYRDVPAKDVVIISAKRIITTAVE